MYLTKDLQLAGFIYCKGVPLSDVQIDNSKKFAWFVFENQEKCRELEKVYWDKKGKVEVTSYLSSLNFLKQRLFQLNSKNTDTMGARGI
jgi:hypothetical protein